MAIETAQFEQLELVSAVDIDGTNEDTVLIGTIEKVIFYNSENGYTVFHVKPKGAKSDLDERVTAVGNLPELREGDEYRFEGEWRSHHKYGKQFAVETCELLLPVTRQGAIRYLSTIAYGVGPAKARRIVDGLGDNALDLIRENPSCLKQFDFLKPDQAQEIADNIAQNETAAELSGLICREGITPALVQKIVAKFGSDSIQVVKDNPYVLADELWGVGFKKADAVAQAIGIEQDSPFRVRAAVKYLLTEAGSEGHCYLRPRDVLAKAKELLDFDVDVQLVSDAVEGLIEAGEAVREGNAVYAKHLHSAEVRLAAKVREFANRPSISIHNMEALIDWSEEDAGVEYAPMQREAVKEAVTNGLSIVTGGPGTGKTTVIRSICEISKREKLHRHILLASPTGRAAQRMTEATGYEAKTIHRLLRYNPNSGGFEHGYGNPLPGSALVVVDEASMMDVELAEDLFAALDPSQHQVVLVGDVDQLPSVGPGSVLRDTIRSHKITTTRLRYNYRQAGGSKIAEYANDLTEGKTPPTLSSGDYEYVSVSDDVMGASEVLNQVRLARKRGMGVMDFQVLAPMRRGKCGVNALNQAIRDIVNPWRKGIPQIGQFRASDKVMVVRNDYDLGVFNGQIGLVEEVRKGNMMVNIDGTSIDFKVEDLDLLQLAYAATIHKSQGSEFPLVIMPLLRHHYIMLTRNIAYTGFTRAKHRLVLISDGFGIKKATQNNKIEDRYSLLAERIQNHHTRDGNNDEKAET